MSYDITLITPTGGRPEAFALCEQYVGRRKTDLSIQWIIVNDFDDAPHLMATDIIRPQPRWKEGDKTLGRNIMAAAEHIQSDFVLFIEDDDWYHPSYFQTYYDALQNHDMVGQGAAKYYNVATTQYMIHTNQKHASLCQTGIRTETLLKNLHCFEGDYPFHDLALWRSECNKVIEPVSNLCIGIKGMAGRAGLGMGHRQDLSLSKDHNFAMLHKWIGDDAENYKGFVNASL